MPEARKPRPALLAPYAASCEGQQRLQRRFEALEVRCRQNIEALWARLDSLPAAASFEPFAHTSAPAAGAAEAAAQQPPRRAAGRRGLASAGAQTHALARVGRAAAVATPAAAAAAGSRSHEPLGALGRALAGGAATAAAASVQPGQAVDAALGDGTGAWLAAARTAPVVQSAEAVAALVEQLISAVSPRARRAPVTDIASAVASGGLGRLIDDALAGAPARPGGGSRSAPSSEAATGAAGADETARVVAAAAKRRANPILGVADVLTPWFGAKLAVGGPGQPALAGLLRQPVPRAASRLVQGGAAVVPMARDIESATPAPDREAELPEHDVSSALNRALLDQAWLRGVDLR